MGTSKMSRESDCEPSAGCAEIPPKITGAVSAQGEHALRMAALKGAHGRDEREDKGCFTEVRFVRSRSLAHFASRSPAPRPGTTRNTPTSADSGVRSAARVGLRATRRL